MFSKELTDSYPEAIKFLTNSINKNKLANSYIFIGRTVNDLTLCAINLAKILNCEQNKITFSTPCGICTNCKWLEKNEHPQALHIISPDIDSKKEQIKIDSIRELLNSLLITSTYFRIICFQKSNLNSLPAECCNLLLKTVEETPARTVFIFTNSTKNDILPTILSRSQTIYFTKKIKTFDEVMNCAKTADSSFLEFIENNISSVLERASKTHKYLTENEISLKDYLLNLANLNYSKYKYSDPKQYCNIYKNLTSSYLQGNSFMQSKIVIENLLLKSLEKK